MPAGGPAGTGCRGTGFLVAPNQVMTAAHVVASPANRAASYAGTDIELLFETAAGTRKLVTGVSITAYHPDTDWALLTFTGQVDGKPFALRPLAPRHLIHWWSFGFSNASPDSGRAYRGSFLTRKVRHLQLVVDDKDGDPSGLSGAPCVVDGTVQAMIVEAASAASSETLFAVCMSIVGQRSKLVDREEPPFVPDSEWRLEKLPAAMLDGAAGKLGIPDPASTIPRESKPRAVAEAVLRCGMACDLDRPIDALFQLTAELDPAHAQAVLMFVAMSWIARGAVKAVCDAFERGTKIAVINSNDPTIGEWFIQRAACFANDLHPGRYRKIRQVDVEVTSRDVIRARIRVAVDELLRSLNSAAIKDIGDIGKHRHDKLPLVLILPVGVSRSDLDTIRKDLSLDEVCFVILVKDLDDKMRADYADSIIVPELDDQAASDAITRYAEAADLLRAAQP